MIYLDNSSTTHRKPLSVIFSSVLGLTYHSINPSRASYKQGISTSQKVYKCRERLSQYLNAEPENVILCSGCTMALNLGIIGTAKKDGHIITTIYEHNSVLRVLEHLKTTHNIQYTVISPDKSGHIRDSDIVSNIRDNTYMVIINHTSNVTGTTQNIDEISTVCQKHNLILFVDGAQSVGHEKIDMKKMHINLLSIAGHKGLYAPQGIGALLINDCEVSPITFGGTGTYSDSLIQPIDYPDGLESGTPNIVGILGLSAGVEFVSAHQDKINKKITRLTTYLLEELKKIPSVKVFSNTPHSGVVSLLINNQDSVNISSILDEKYHICTRSGLHCAPLIHKYLGTTQTGLTRISLSYFNNKREIKHLIKAIKEIASN